MPSVSHILASYPANCSPSKLVLEQSIYKQHPSSAAVFNLFHIIVLNLVDNAKANSIMQNKLCFTFLEAHLGSCSGIILEQFAGFDQLLRYNISTQGYLTSDFSFSSRFHLAITTLSVQWSINFFLSQSFVRLPKKNGTFQCIVEPNTMFYAFLVPFC